MIVENDHYSRSQAVVCHAFDRSRIPGRKIWGERGSEWTRAGVAASFFVAGWFQRSENSQMMPQNEAS